jgi:GT2 family glycosyltransferase
MHRPYDLDRTLRSINKANGFDSLIRQIIIIDQSEDNKTKQIITKFKKTKYYYQNEKSSTKARNFGVTMSKTPFVVFLDDDVIVSKDFFVQLEKAIKNNPKAILFGGNINPPANNKYKIKLWIKLIKTIFLHENFFKNQAVLINGRNGMYKRFLKNKPISVEWISCCCMIVKRDIFNLIKFDEKLKGYAFGEDVLFTNTIVQKFGKVALLIPSAKIQHLESKSARITSEERKAMEVKNRFYICGKLAKNKTISYLALYWSFIGDVLLKVIRYTLLKRSIDFKPYFNIITKIIFNKNFYKSPLEEKL